MRLPFSIAKCSTPLCRTSIIYGVSSGIKSSRWSCRTRKLKPRLPTCTGQCDSAELIYGTGLRVNECMTLRVKDVDFDLRTITVHAGKGYKDRATVMPQVLIPDLRMHLTKVAQLHKADVLKGNGYAPMPNALYVKYPSASQSMAWQYFFPSSRQRPWQNTGQLARWHASPSTLRRAFKQAVRQANIHKHVGPHTLRHSFASHLFTGGRHRYPDDSNIVRA